MCTNAMVIDQHENAQLTIKARHPDRPNAWETTLILKDVTFAGYQGRNAQFWTGTDAATGEQVQLGAVFRARSGCAQCGGR